MDFSLIIWILVVAVVLSIAFAVIKFLIMPAIAPGAQVYVWAILGVLILIGLLYVISNGGFVHGHGFSFR
jgi:hypothetical protein